MFRYEICEECLEKGKPEAEVDYRLNEETIASVRCPHCHKPVN